MRTNLLKYALPVAAVAVLLIGLPAGAPEAQTQTQARTAAKGTMAPLPEGACATSNGYIENGRTCAAAPNELQWSSVRWCVQGELHATLAACWEPSGLCEPKC